MYVLTLVYTYVKCLLTMAFTYMTKQLYYSEQVYVLPGDAMIIMIHNIS